ncbi:MAG: prolipoprotein diacylglyceryl transferase, partial [Actinomycetales bacterium]|nr:prolipoprotein diacylglyceryl transferase [Actinomycetales bacterium]
KLTTTGVSRLALMDSAALGLAIGQLFGRIGCISVGEHLGGPTHFFLGWTYLGGTTRELGYLPGQTYHNTAIYEFLWLIPLIGLLLWLDRGRGDRQVAPGTLLGTFIVGYATLRFGTDFLRINDKTVVGLTGAQFMCAAVFPVGIWLLIRRRNQGQPVDVSPTQG